MDSAGNLYIADSGNSRVRRVAPDGEITTVAGNGTTGTTGLTPGLVGLYQVDAQVPAGSAKGNAVPVVVSMGSVNSNTVSRNWTVT